MYISKCNYKTCQTPEQDSETHFMCSSEPDGAAAGKHGVYYSLRRHLAAGGTDVNLSHCFPEPPSKTFTNAEVITMKHKPKLTVHLDIIQEMRLSVIGRILRQV